ncbi:hypothetical protein BH09ACT7_BH09ACT7_54980 [soil metagenome]
MASTKYIGYISGAAVAAGVGAAIAVAGQGTAQADTDGAKPASSTESKATSDAKEAKPEKKNAGPKRTAKPAEDDADASSTATKPKPTFDPTETVKELKTKFAGLKPKPTVDADPTPTVDEVSTKPAVIKPFTPLTDLAEKASAAATLLKPLAALQPKTVEPQAAVDSSWYVPNTGPVQWNWNPFRKGDPIPEGMPQIVWQLEQGAVNLFEPLPVLQPLVREGFEAGYRVSQMIPWVNVVLPVSNIIAQIPNLTSGDPVQFKTATQSIINNLLVTTTPVAILFYGYDQIADVVNLEWEAQQVKSWFYSTTWDVLDFFHLLHNQGESGLPLSTTPAGSGAGVTAPEQTVKLAAYSMANTSTVATTTDELGSNPFRADDPWLNDMPANLLGIEKAIVAALPVGGPIFREAFEAVYRASQVVPFVNVPIPLDKILRAFASGDGTAIQTAVNQLLLTTQPVSLLYYGYDEIVDLLNIEDQGYELKQTFYSTIWDLVDSTGVFHVLGESGI